VDPRPQQRDRAGSERHPDARFPEGRLDVGDIYNQITFWQSLNLVGRDVAGREVVDLSFVRCHTNVPRG
jgi:hypothetical protein